MENPGFLECLDADFARMKAAASRDLTAAVPTCPGWTASDLVRHVGEVYLHKALAMREGVEPEPWPPRELAEEEPLTLLDRAHAELTGEFAARRPGDPAGSWYTPDRTVGFWIRRMAHETAVHRIDAELAAGGPVSETPDGLAVDGVDELLRIFVAYAVEEWGEYFTAILSGSPGRTYHLRTSGAAWRVRTGPGLFAVEGGPGASGGDGSGGSADDPADVTVSGAPSALLRWVWNRDAEGEPGGVAVEGAQEAVDEFRRCVAVATQ
ncbi:TIGR03083 family protein [Streptomyces sp. WMMB 714]|uniref:maleylpyruvate isomerase family mycothiol-dependent enzyme n=1 Tax=Streptomyces sp. WMMB 714 TaxID=1286822 RepID=UPI0005F875A9|nr:maleylpyruvate isomerase family mycothiol-dependent enzyme [Streptomyces sp. WMMB 714]SCK40010.1 TIGR03083 family protein [Streptomyces sp. WMMB 714]